MLFIHLKKQVQVASIVFLIFFSLPKSARACSDTDFCKCMIMVGALLAASSSCLPCVCYCVAPIPEATTPPVFSQLALSAPGKFESPENHFPTNYEALLINNPMVNRFPFSLEQIKQQFARSSVPTDPRWSESRVKRKRKRKSGRKKHALQLRSSRLCHSATPSSRHQKIRR